MTVFLLRFDGGRFLLQLFHLLKRQQRLQVCNRKVEHLFCYACVVDPVLLQCLVMGGLTSFWRLLLQM